MMGAVVLGFVGRALRVLLGLKPLATTAYPLAGAVRPARQMLHWIK